MKAGREWCCQTAVLPLVDVLREPAEALAVALPLQDAAHEHLQRPRVQLLQRDVALRRRTGITVSNNEEKQQSLHYYSGESGHLFIVLL